MATPRVVNTCTKRNPNKRIIVPVFILRGVLSFSFPKYSYLFSEQKGHVLVELTEEYLVKINVPKSDAQAIIKSFNIEENTCEAARRLKDPYRYLALNQSISGPAGMFREVLFKDFPLFSDLFSELHEDDIGVLTEEYMMNANVSMLDARKIMRHFIKHLNKSLRFSKGVDFSYY